MRSEPVRGWKDVRLGEHVDLLVGFAFKSSEFTRSQDGIRLLRGDNVGQGRLRWNGPRKWPVRRSSEFERYELRPRDIVLAMDRPWIEAGLKYAVVRNEDVPCLLVQRVARLRGTATLCQRYLSFVIGSPAFTTYVRAVQTGTAVPHISGGQIADLRFCMPPRQEQERIAYVLGALDDKIDSNRRLAALLEQTAAELFRARFVDFVGAEEFEDSEIGRIPRGWRVAPIGDVLKVVGGSTPSTKEPRYWDGTHCWATPKDLSGARSPVLLDTDRHITDEGVSQISSRLLPQRTVLLSSRAPVGYTAMSFVEVAVNQGFIAIPPTDGVPNEFVLFWLREKMGLIKGHAGGTTFAEISKRAFRPLPMLVPPRLLLVEFEQAASPMLDLIAARDQEAKVLASIRDTLLPKLISGALRVPDTTDPVEVIEPARARLAATAR